MEQMKFEIINVMKQPPDWNERFAPGCECVGPRSRNNGTTGRRTKVRDDAPVAAMLNAGRNALDKGMR